MIYSSEIIKNVCAQGVINLDEIYLCADGGTKVAKSKGKKNTVGAIKKKQTQEIFLLYSLSHMERDIYLLHILLEI